MERFGTAVILCGGKSSRMGFDKSKIEINGRLLIEMTCEKLEEVFDEIILVAEDKHKFGNIKYKVVEDIEKSYGPAGGIYTGLKHSSSKYTFFIACDMPKINIEFIQYLKNILETDEYDGIMCEKGDWIEPLHAFYSKDLVVEFQKGIESNRLVLYDIFKNSNIKYVPEDIAKKYSENLEMFVNLNYTGDLEKLKEIY